ncbi:hypothetical protein LAG90_18880 [Marinilongibacter aquaticus]|uniref:OstA-like protein n=1 Tax=Marinilongibacter aquaticus TaxID=2975157 RepID=UPI0021BDDE91|nr:OstA-like protein [Marinilongibacter aquaticus]UBM58865.1 hypothetical protein LAG90_18880 [Marinilongibacter aquaticus]
MPKIFLRGFIVFVFSLLGPLAFAQKPLNPPVDKGPKSKIELISADSLIGTSGENAQRTFYGKVKFLHRGVYLNCRKAVHNAKENNLEAYGDILINQGDTLTITGDTLYYDGNTRKAKILGKKVRLEDDDITLDSKQLNYDINSDLAYYPVPGVIHQDSAILSSNSGYYNTETKLFNYLGNVEILHPDFVLCTDTLDYYSDLKKAVFESFTTIHSDDGNLSAERGYYFTDSKQSEFVGRSMVENEKYSLSADTLNFNLKIEEGFGLGNVEFISKADSIIINGDYGEKKADKGFTQMNGHALLRAISNADTLFLSAKTITAFNSIDSVMQQIKKDSLVQTDSVQQIPEVKVAVDTSQKADKIEFIIADKEVKIFRSDFQSLCDSLNYNLIDSVITFIGKPIIWSDQNQMEGELIEAQMVNSKIRKLFLHQNGFIIAQDSISKFDQVKGRQIIADFDSLTQIRDVYVNGNGESIYYTLDDKNRLIGLNRIACSRIYLNFKGRQVNRISFAGQAESKLIPPVEISESVQKLENFNWRIDRKPSKSDVLGQHEIPIKTEEN